MVKIADFLRAKGVKIDKKRNEPLWKGPHEDGITQSLLSRFLVCRERFRLLVIEGLGAGDRFNHRLAYGDLWHVCEEEFARTKGAHDNWARALKEFCSKLVQKYRMQQTEIVHWYEVCKIQFPLYVKYWAKHPDMKQRRPIFQEQVFKIPYTLPSGRVVYLRGKFDSVDSVWQKGKSQVWLQENKTKGDVKENRMRSQLTFDLQTMFYLVALHAAKVDTVVEAGKTLKVNGWRLEPGKMLAQPLKEQGPIAGIRYNVIRRPLSGGKGTIRPHKATKTKPAETMEAFYKRVQGVISADPQSYFMRWNVTVSQKEVDTFKDQFLNPILEQLCDWWDWIGTLRQMPFDTQGNDGIHWRYPYGIYNPLLEGIATDMDEYLSNGSKVGLGQVETLFGELETPKEDQG